MKVSDIRADRISINGGCPTPSVFAQVNHDGYEKLILEHVEALERRLVEAYCSYELRYASEIFHSVNEQGKRYIKDLLYSGDPMSAREAVEILSSYVSDESGGYNDYGIYASDVRRMFGYDDIAANYVELVTYEEAAKLAYPCELHSKLREYAVDDIVPVLSLRFYLEIAVNDEIFADLFKKIYRLKKEYDYMSLFNKDQKFNVSI